MVLLPYRSELSVKITVPVAVDGETVAAKVTDLPEMEGLALEVTVVVVLAFTVCVRVVEEPP
jgi:hypothetical protein